MAVVSEGFRDWAWEQPVFRLKTRVPPRKHVEVRGKRHVGPWPDFKETPTPLEGGIFGDAMHLQ